MEPSSFSYPNAAVDIYLFPEFFSGSAAAAVVVPHNSASCLLRAWIMASTAAFAAAAAAVSGARSAQPLPFPHRSIIQGLCSPHGFL